MKYLKLYSENFNNGISISNIVYDIQDICLELKDNGLIVDYEFPASLSKVPNLIFNIKISNDIKIIEYYEIKDVLERIKVYLSHLNYMSSVSLTGFNYATMKWSNLSDEDVYNSITISIALLKNNISENHKTKGDILYDIQDICQEAEDEGLVIDIYNNRVYIRSKMSLQGKYSAINYYKIVDIINRIKDYLGKKFLSEELMICGETGYTHCMYALESEIEKLTEENKICGVKINFNLDK